ncbi:MAG: DNA polymerase III subunit gamma/tau, partial [Phycisphaeraceae bacterium]|nr:DNA polymerase III subunit gamma/tau [Phycisphaeraceae bacterium]
MSYTALARRYRSQSFDQVIGQEPIAQTLCHAIASDRLHHAYLFCGTRGVGKTTMARLLARAINAPDTVEGCPRPKGIDYPDREVQQRMAEAIMRGDDMNVIEIDAASNTGVDNVRDIIANANLAPTGNARFKVYIIDEVHMLSKAAFNALLKIMEEPPAHVKFILCTTEPHKVLPTIHSRCQRFDFQNIPSQKIVDHLAEVARSEDVEAETAVLFQIARQANGSMRDALSLLDRLLSAGKSCLDGQLLSDMLGLPDQQLVAELVGAIGAADVAGTLSGIEQLTRRGIAQDQLIESVIEHLRNLMVLSACGPETDLVELDPTARQEAAAQAEGFETAMLVHSIALLESVQRASRTSPAPRALLEAAMVRLAMSEQFSSLASLLGGQGRPAGSTTQKKKLTPAPEVPRTAPAEASSPPKTDPMPPASSSKPRPRPSAAPGSPISQSERDRLMRSPL